MRDFDDDYEVDDEYIIYKQKERTKKQLCGEIPLKIENGNLKCSDCSREFINRTNLVKLQKLDGGKLRRKLEYHRIPYKNDFHRRARFCDLYCKILPNTNLENNLNILLEYFGDKTFIYLFNDLFPIPDIFDETTVSIYLTILLKSVDKGYDMISSNTIVILNKIFEKLLDMIKFKIIFQGSISKQEDFVIKSIFIFFLSIQNIDPKFIKSIIKTYYLSNRINLKHIDYLTDYADGEIELYTHVLMKTNHEIKSFIKGFHKQIRISAQKPESEIRMIFKIVLLGPSGGGKSAISNYIVNKTFLEPKPKSSKLIEFEVRIANFSFLNINYETLLLEFNTDKITYPKYHMLSDVSGILLAFDLNDNDQFAQVELWLKELEKKSELPIIIAANKIDLGKNENISKDKVKRLKKTHRVIDYVECSAKTGDKIDILFQKLCLEIIKEWKI